MNADLSHPAAIWKRDGEFFGHIPELGILEKDADIGGLWTKLERRKLDAYARFQEAGIVQEFPRPRSVDPAMLDRPTRRFLVRTAAVTLALVLCIWALGAQMHSVAGSLARTVGRELSSKTLVQKLIVGLETLPDEKKARAHEDLRKIVQALQPYAEDLRPLFAELVGSGGRVASLPISAAQKLGRQP